VTLPATLPLPERVRGDYDGRNVLVAGAGVSGVAAAEVLLRAGARVTVVDAVESARTEALALLGARVQIGLSVPPDGTELVVTSPGWRPDAPLLCAAAAAGVEVIGEVELAWRVQPQHPGHGSAAGHRGRGSAPGHRGRGTAPWLGVTGTNGKTTTVRMLEAILRAAGLRTVAAGNVGLPLLQAVLDPDPYDVLAVELSSFQLHWTSRVACTAGAVLNLAPDHLDWHGSMAAYAADKRTIWRGAGRAVFNGDDPRCRKLAEGRDDTHPFHLGPPEPGGLGVVDGELVDAAFPTVGATGPEPGLVLARVADVGLSGSHNVANALAAAALARSLTVLAAPAGEGPAGEAGDRPAYEVEPAAVRDGLRAVRPGAHRNVVVGTVDGLTWVDDSKATNPHAAAASLSAYPSVVWIAGGLLKGADVDDVVREHAARLSAAVLLGRDRAAVRQAIARHAPHLPVREVERTDDGAMAEVVEHARALASPGDTVLLAPAAASMDMFRDYAARGDAFAAAVAARAQR